MLVVEQKDLGHGMTKEIEPSMMFDKLLNRLYGVPVMIELCMCFTKLSTSATNNTDDDQCIVDTSSAFAWCFL